MDKMLSLNDLQGIKKKTIKRANCVVFLCMSYRGDLLG